MYQKFIINQDGVLRFGRVFLHKELLAKGERCVYGGGLWNIDSKSGGIVLFGRSFDFGTPDFEGLRKIDWTGVGGRPLPLLYLPKWPDTTVVQPVFVKNNEKTRVLITGANGFLGSRIAWFLEEKCGYEIYAPSHKEMEITDIDSCIKAVSSFKPDYVIHCAAISSTAFCQDNPEASRKTNIEGTCNVVCAADINDARCIYMSSDQVYHNDTNKWTQTFKEEDVDFQNNPPINVYARDKLLMEMKAREIDASSIALRLTWMYDSKESSSMPDCPEHLKENHGILANIQKAKNDGAPIKASIYERRGVTDVWEVVRKVAEIIAKKDVPGGVYNCGSECSCTTYELYMQLAEQWGLDKSSIIPDNSFSRSLAMDTTKISEI
ncbi:MAG: SDR family oxidoreductase [Candidatus Limimorpha sp.]